MTSKTDIPADLSKILFDNQAVVVVQPIADYRHCLYQSELALVSDVSEKRLLEFSTGRDCAHQALHKTGYETCPILKGEQREPLWPEGVAGSISHCKDLAGAVVADKKQIHSVGFDIENRKTLNPNIARHVCTEQEKEWLAKQDSLQQNLGLLLIFSIKEAVFKCIHQIANYSLRFSECRVVPEISTHQAEIEIISTHLQPYVPKVKTSFHFTATHVFCSAYAPHLPAVG